jgi:hypothetical protein
MRSDKRQRRLLYRARATVPPGQWFEYRIGNTRRQVPGRNARLYLCPTPNSAPLRFRFRPLLLSQPLDNDDQL